MIQEHLQINSPESLIKIYIVAVPEDDHEVWIRRRYLANCLSLIWAPLSFKNHAGHFHTSTFEVF